MKKNGKIIVLENAFDWNKYFCILWMVYRFFIRFRTMWIWCTCSQLPWLFSDKIWLWMCVCGGMIFLNFSDRLLRIHRPYTNHFDPFNTHMNARVHTHTQMYSLSLFVCLFLSGYRNLKLHKITAFVCETLICDIKVCEMVFRVKYRTQNR